jgi:hypothetical protein
MTLGIAGKEVIVLRTTESEDGLKMFVKTAASGYDDSKRYVQSRLKMLT